MIVSHDRYFMDRLVDHIFVFEGDGIVKDFNGNYTEYRIQLDLKGEVPKVEMPTQVEKTIVVETKKKVKMSYKEKFEFENLEKEMERLEKEKSELTDKLSTSSKHEELQAWSNRINQISKLLDESTMRWLELSELEQ
jgi:ATP-binding cassette subfamily F protein uup